MSQPVRWGILGTARIAEKVAAAIRSASNAELLVAGSRDAGRAAEWADKHGASKSVGSYNAVLEDPAVDAVYIPLPPSMHAEWTIKAAAAGKHVLCEKPLAGCASEAREMVAACAEHGVQFMDGVMWLHHPREADMHLVLAGSELGELRHLASAFTFCWPQIPENDFRTKREYGGGSLLDLGWYCVGVALWAFGEMPERVFGTARWRNDVDMHFNGLMWFSGGRTASLDCGFDTVMRRWVEIAGTEKSLVCDDFTRPWKAESPRFWVHQSDGSADERRSDSPVQEVCMIEQFCRAVQSGSLVPAWPERALRTQIICEALDKSARSGEVITVRE